MVFCRRGQKRWMHFGVLTTSRRIYSGSARIGRSTAIGTSTTAITINSLLPLLFCLNPSLCMSVCPKPVLANSIVDFPHYTESRIRACTGGFVLSHVCIRDGTLSYDNHYLHAMVAPRSLLLTEAYDDFGANPAVYIFNRR